MRGRGLHRALVLLVMAGCGSSGSDTTTGPTSGGANAVAVGDNFYAPTALSVATGATVTWQWAQGASEHTVTFDDGAPGSQRQSSGTFQRTFSTPGTYTYFCQVHGRQVMAGSVTVGAMTGGTGGGGGGGGGGYDYSIGR